MKKLPLCLLLLASTCYAETEKFEPTQEEAEKAMQTFFVMVNSVSEEMAKKMKTPKQHVELKKMTLKKCEEDKFEGERAAYCDIDTVIVEDGKEEKQELKEQITDDLLPRAFTKTGRTHAVCDTQHGFLLINGAGSKAENLLTKLREALGGLEARLPQAKQSPGSLMTEWLLRGACGGGFELDNSCELKGQGDAAPVVKIAKQDLTVDEVRRHLDSGKTVTQLGLVWREQIAFVLTDDFALKRIQYLDVLQEEAEQQGDDAASLAFASQILMAQSLSLMIGELAQHLGGWQE